METLSFRAKHDYSGSMAGIEVPIGLSLDGTRSVRLVAKVDTGADFCIFQREYAEQLGIEVESGRHQVIVTAAGQFDAYGHTVSLSCLDWTFEMTVYFAAPRKFGRNVVGRAGWLQNFRLGLIDHDSLLFLSAYDE